MKIFLSYRHTGEDLKALQGVISSVCESLSKGGHSSFCTLDNQDFFKEKQYSYKQILDHALKELDESDCVLVILKSKEKSEGMLIEIGYAMAKGKKIIVAMKRGVQTTFIPEVADQVIEFDEFAELYEKLEEIKIS